MKKTVRKIAGRVAVLVAVLLLLGAILTGCSSSKKLTAGNVSIQQDDENQVLNSISAENLGKIAGTIADAYSSDPKILEKFMAAYRGYDMTVDNFDDSAIKESEEERSARNAGENFSVDATVKVLNKAYELTKTSDGVDYSAINRYDAKSILDAFSSSVNIESDTGIIDTLLSWIGTALNWMTNTICFGNYLVGICLFAVIVEILMLPFAIKQQKNSIKQAKLRPKEMAIRKKYAGRTDQATAQKMQQEIQDFYARENFSPYSGCLPLLIQFPILIALYNIVIDPLHYVLGQASAMTNALASYCSASAAAGGLGSAMVNTRGTISILADIRADSGIIEGMKDFLLFKNGGDVYNALSGISAKIPNFGLGSLNLGLNPSFSTFNWLLLVPVLTFATYFLTAKLSRKFTYQPMTNQGADNRQTACSNAMMDFIMPAFSTWFTFLVPALIGIYWAFRSLVGLLKTFIMSRVMPLPTFTEEDYKAAEKEMAGKKQVKKSQNVGKVRSLHHIDDEDFDDTRERALARKAAIEEREREEQQKKADGALLNAAPIKDDDRKKKTKKEADAEENDSASNDTNDQSEDK